MFADLFLNRFLFYSNFFSFQHDKIYGSKPIRVKHRQVTQRGARFIKKRNEDCGLGLEGVDIVGVADGPGFPAKNGSGDDATKPDLSIIDPESLKQSISEAADAKIKKVEGSIERPESANADRSASWLTTPPRAPRVRAHSDSKIHFSSKLVNVSTSPLRPIQSPQHQQNLSPTAPPPSTVYPTPPSFAPSSSSEPVYSGIMAPIMEHPQYYSRVSYFVIHR